MKKVLKFLGRNIFYILACICMFMALQNGSSNWGIIFTVLMGTALILFKLEVLHKKLDEMELTYLRREVENKENFLGLMEFMVGKWDKEGQ